MSGANRDTCCQEIIFVEHTRDSLFSSVQWRHVFVFQLLNASLDDWLHLTGLVFELDNGSTLVHLLTDRNLKKGSSHGKTFARVSTSS